MGLLERSREEDAKDLNEESCEHGRLVSNVFGRSQGGIECSHLAACPIHAHHRPATHALDTTCLITVHHAHAHLDVHSHSHHHQKPPSSD